MKDTKAQILIIIISFRELVNNKLDLEDAENRICRIHEQENKTAMMLYEDSLQAIRKLLWHSVLTDLSWFYDKRGDRSVFWYLNQIKLDNKSLTSDVDKYLSQISKLEDTVKKIKTVRNKWISHRDKAPFENPTTFWTDVNIVNLQDIDSLVGTLQDIFLSFSHENLVDLTDSTDSRIGKLFDACDLIIEKNPELLVESTLHNYIEKENQQKLNERDIEIINKNAELINKQVAETLEFQAEW